MAARIHDGGHVVTYAELEAFFTELVATAQARGIPCGITSGMACVHFGIAATTKDCDVLCAVAKSDAFRELVAMTELRGLRPNYRGSWSVVAACCPSWNVALG